VANASEEAMRELEASELLSPGAARRPHLSHSQVAADPSSYWRAIQAMNDAAPAGGSVLPGILARQAIEALGKARHEPAVPVLIRFWSDCPIREVWMAAGGALLAIGASEALAALSDRLDEYDPDGRITMFAVRAVFQADPASAYDRLAGCFDRERLAAPGGVAVPFRVVKALGPVGRDADGALVWVDPSASDWFRADPRWLDLCVALREDEQLRDIIEHVLDYADPDDLAAGAARDFEPF
jgi:hypothetical protein